MRHGTTKRAPHVQNRNNLNKKINAEVLDYNPNQKIIIPKPTLNEWMAGWIYRQGQRDIFHTLKFHVIFM